MFSISHLRNRVQTAMRPHRNYSLHILALFLAGTLGLSLIQPALAATAWQIQVLDSATGDVGSYNALALDSSGNPVVSYYADGPRDLKVIHCGDPTCSNGNTIVTVDSAADVGRYNSLKLDRSGNPVISYYDDTNGALKLVHCGDPTCSNRNTIATVDNYGNVWAYSSLELDSSGNPVIVYVDIDGISLKMVRCGDSTCSSGNFTQTVIGPNAEVFDVSFVLDSLDRPVISYFSYHSISKWSLWLVHCGNTLCTSGNTIRVLDAPGGMYTSLALDRFGNPVISYFNQEFSGATAVNEYFRLAYCYDAACTTSPSIEYVDKVDGTSVGGSTSLLLDSSGRPVISYSYNHQLKFVSCGNPMCSSGNTIQVLDEAAGGGRANLNSLALDSSGKPVISYHDFYSHDLKLARLVDDILPPTVTVNQVPGQADPTNSNPVLFNATFSEDVTSFTNADVTLSGTANLAGASIRVSGGPRDYTISISGLTGNGTVIATIAAGVATDAAGNPNTASASTDNSVTVKFDSTPPVIIASLGPTTPNGQNGWYVSVVTVNFTCADEAGGSGLAANTVAGVTLSTDGANQNITNTGTCSDKAGNSAAPVTISGLNLDKTPPTLNPVVSPNPVQPGAAASVTSGATDALSGLASQSCGALDASTPGSKSVTCTATDQAGNTASAAVQYTVLAPLTLRQQLQAVRTTLATLVPSGDKKNDERFNKALSKLDQALATKLWQADGNHLTLIGDDVFNRLQDAVQELGKLKQPPAAVRTLTPTLVSISRSLAQLALDEASGGGVNASKLAKARSKLSKGDSEAANGKAAKAIANYEDAWEYAQQACGRPVAASLDADELSLDDASESNDSDPATLPFHLFLPVVNR